MGRRRSVTEDLVKLRLHKNFLTENDKTLRQFETDNSKILAALKKAEDIEEEALEALDFRQEIQHVLVKIELLLERDEAARLQSQTKTSSRGETSSGITKVNCKLPKLSYVVCRRFEGRFYPDVIPSALTASRVSDDPAFTYVGVDFAGPLYVKRTPSNQESPFKKDVLDIVYVR